MSKPVFKNLFTASGRRNRKSYIFAMIAIWLVAFAPAIPFVYLVPEILSGFFDFEESFNGGILILAVILVILMFVLWILCFLAGIFIDAQRIRDIGYAGLLVIPLHAGIILFSSYIPQPDEPESFAVFDSDSVFTDTPWPEDPGADATPQERLDYHRKFLDRIEQYREEQRVFEERMNTALDEMPRYFLSLLIPGSVLPAIVSIALAWIPGTQGKNKYGADPLRATLPKRRKRKKARA